MDNKTRFFTVVLKELVYIVNKVVTPISSGFNTPASRSRANSFTAGSSEDMLSPEEHAEINMERNRHLEEMLANSGFIVDRNARPRQNNRRIADPRRAISPANSGY